MSKMQNWSRLETWQPEEIFYPENETQIQTKILQALELKKKIRVIGTGHSFTALCNTQNVVISLDKYQGLISVDKAKQQATFKAGTKLSILNELLFKEGLAMPNMGDINEQSIAGAIGTGTHGTGIKFGNISTQVTQIKFVNGKGEIIICSESENTKTFKAAQISLGVLGVITEITLQCVPTYKLEHIIDKTTLVNVLDNLEELNNKNRNFEFYWFPNTEYVMTKTVNESNAPPDESSFSNYLQEMVIENYGFKLLCEMGNWFPKKSNAVSSLTAKLSGYNKKVNYSHNVFTTQRIVRFNEMEYNVPLAAYKEVKKDITNWINKNNRTVMFPIENRFVQGDDIYLSPAYKRDSAYIAVHVYHKKPYKEYFNAIEEIFLAHEGRPHWGKLNSLTPQMIDERYPEFQTFMSERKKHDPDNVFVTNYIKELLLG